MTHDLLLAECEQEIRLSEQNNRAAHGEHLHANGQQKLNIAAVISKPSSNTLWLIKMACANLELTVLNCFVSLGYCRGVAAQVSISSLRDNLTQSIDSQSKELLGADLEVRRTAPFDSV